MPADVECKGVKKPSVQTAPCTMEWFPNMASPRAIPFRPLALRGTTHLDAWPDESYAHGMDVFAV